MKDRLFTLIETRAKDVLAHRVYAIDDFRPTDLRRAVALDMALIKSAMTPYLDAQTSQVWFGQVVAAVLSLPEAVEAGLTEEALLPLISEAEDNYFAGDGGWLANLRDTVLAWLTAKHAVVHLTARQQAVMRGIAMIFVYDAILLHCAVEVQFGGHYELGRLNEERAHMADAFLRTYGWVTMRDAGFLAEEPVDIPLRGPMLATKRLFDVISALAVLVLISPIFLLLILILAFENGPIFYSQRRIGRNGQSFRCHKFRTMVPNAEKILADLLLSDPAAREEWQKYEKLRKDPRTTRLGRFLRKTSLDELPQLFNVLKGEMSMVGPRPMAMHERERWGGYYGCYKSVPPGVTGPWQIYYRSDSDYQSRIDCLQLYLETWSPLQDVKYMLLTVTVPFAKGAC